MKTEICTISLTSICFISCNQICHKIWNVSITWHCVSPARWSTLSATMFAEALIVLKSCCFLCHSIYAALIIHFFVCYSAVNSFDFSTVVYGLGKTCMSCNQSDNKEHSTFIHHWCWPHSINRTRLVQEVYKINWHIMCSAS